MPKQKRGPSPGLGSVGLLALHDRKFFARLLKKPETAMKAIVAEGKLKLSKADMDRVVKLIADYREANSDAELMGMWEKYHKAGAAGSGIWKHKFL